VNVKGGEKTYHAHLWGMASRGWLHRLLTLKRSTLYSEGKIMEGFLFASLFHAVVNILFELGWGAWAVPIIVVGMAFVFGMYKSGQKETRLISRHLEPKHA